jgi:NADPH:quinone reductase
MRAWTIREFGPFQEVLRLEEQPSPSPPPGTALIRVRTAGVNFPDLLMIAGKYQVRPPLPFIPGFETAGEVVEAPPGSGIASGDRVMCQVGHGAFCEALCAAPEDLFSIPDDMSDEQAAAFFLTYQTAWVALVHRARLRPGELLLVHGGAGGVGSAAIQLGKALGAVVVATAGGEEKAAVCRQLGADHAIDYAGQDFAAAVQEITSGRGADVILDPVGGDVFDRSTRCIAWEGRLLPIGFTSGRIPAIAANRLLLKNISVLGLYWGSYWQRAPHVVREAYAGLVELYERGSLRPLIHRLYPMEGLPEALAAVAGRRCRGKAVLAVQAPEPRRGMPR